MMKNKIRTLLFLLIVVTQIDAICDTKTKSKLTRDLQYLNRRNTIYEEIVFLYNPIFPLDFGNDCAVPRILKGKKVHGQNFRNWI
jgi:hypothetical protein